MFRWLLIVSLSFASLCGSASLADVWPGFRGPNGSSVGKTAPPTKWDLESGENVAWTADLAGRGVSGPIVAGGRVFVTASSGPTEDRLHVFAFDAGSGKQLWQRQFWATGRTLFHPTSANAAPTPATDGERIYAFYSSNDLICLDLAGNVQWMRGLVLEHPRLGNDVGMASSPVVAGEAVVVQCECQGDSFAAAFDRRTGKALWTIPREPGANWASPVATSISVDGVATPAVVLQGSDGVALYSAATGERLASVDLPTGGIASVTVVDNALLVPASDGKLHFVSLVAGDIDPKSRRWASPTLSPGNASPLQLEAGVCVLTGAGVLVLGDPATGEVLWRKRLGGSFWATPVAAGNTVYAVSDSGTVFVVDAANKGEIVGEYELGEGQDVLGSPAIADGALYIRSHTKLWKIAEKK